MAALEQRVSESVELRADVLVRQTRRDDTSGINEHFSRQVRLEMRKAAGPWNLRSDLSHRYLRTESDYWSWLTVVNLETDRLGRWQAWSNLSIDDPGRGIRRWYVFLSHRRAISRAVEMQLKFAHGYQSESPTRHESTASFEWRLSL
jgi:hypothetical protein